MEGDRRELERWQREDALSSGIAGFEDGERPAKEAGGF